MPESRELKERMQRLVAPVDRRGVWAQIEMRAVLDERRRSKLDRAAARPEKVGHPRLGRARLAAYATLALIVVAGATVGTVIGVDSGQGVFGIDNGQGGHWEEVPLTLEGGGQIWSVQMSSGDPSYLYAGTEEGLYRSSDGAASWQRILSLGAGGWYYTFLDPAATSTVYAVWASWRGMMPAGTETARLMRSDDGGDTWTELTTSVVEAVGREYPDHGRWDMGTLLFDAGTDPSTVYVSVRFRSEAEYPYPLLRSTDRGQTWALVDEAEGKRIWATQQLDFALMDEFHGKYLLDAEARMLGWPTTMVADPDDPSIIYAGTDSGVCKSTDSGKTWTKTNAGMTHKVGGDLVFEPGSGSNMYAVSQEGIFKSEDAGATWKQALNAGYLKDNWGNRICSLALAPSAPSTLYAWTSEGLFRSEDRGDTWAKRAGNRLVNSDTYDMSRALLAVSADDPDTVFAVSGRYLFRSTDGGDNWTRVLERIASADYMDAIISDPKDASTMYALTAEENVGNKYTVFKSVDGGATWKDVMRIGEVLGNFRMVAGDDESLTFYTWQTGSLNLAPDGSPTSSTVALDDLQTVISRSLDGGATWEKVAFTGLKGLVTQLVHDPRSAGAWYAVTIRQAAGGARHREIYRSTDEGVTWRLAFDNLPYGCTELAIGPGAEGALYWYGGYSGTYRWVVDEETTSTSAAGSGSSGGLGCSAP